MSDADFAGAPGATIVLFDGVCNLCTGSVRFLMRRDRRRQFRFASLQSPAGQALVARHGVAEATGASGASGGSLETLVVIEAGRARVRSEAALLLARRLPWPWPMLAVLLALPRALRDALYGFVARHRYRWFGRTESCMVPTSETLEMTERFLDGSGP
jgi:predicted DCC family thiol-disulfide oxidoreductase YuxK